MSQYFNKRIKLALTAQTDFFFPDEYSHVIEIGDEDAYRTCLQLNREECIVAGPSCGLALAGALGWRIFLAARFLVMMFK